MLSLVTSLEWITQTAFENKTALKNVAKFQENHCYGVSFRKEAGQGLFIKRESIRSVFLGNSVFAFEKQSSVLKNFTISAENHPCWSHLLIKLSAFSPAKLLKRDSSTGVFPLNFAKFLKIPFYRTPLGGCWSKVQQSYISAMKTIGEQLLRSHTMSWWRA